MVIIVLMINLPVGVSNHNVHIFAQFVEDKQTVFTNRVKCIELWIIWGRTKSMAYQIWSHYVIACKTWKCHSSYQYTWPVC